LDARTVDIVVDGVKVASGIPYPGVGNYVELDAGEHRVQVFQAGKTGVATVETVVLLAGGQSLTVAVVGNDPVELVSIPDGDDTEPGRGRLRLVNTVPDFPASFDLGVVNGPQIVTGVGYLQASGYMSMVAGTYVLELKRGGTSEQVATGTADIASSTNNTVFAVGTLARGDIGIVAARDAF
jgi:hypothetical protein